MPDKNHSLSKLTAEYVRSILDYDPETGVFTWRKRATNTFRPKHTRIQSVANRWNARFAGKQPSYRDQNGYLHIYINKKRYKSHRLAWLYMTGEWPPEQIDHIDMDPTNNTFSNLRLATHSENQRNRMKPRTNTSGFKGVSWDRLRSRWRAQITIAGRQTYLGLFDDPQDAHAAYARAAQVEYGDFARTE